MFRVLKLDNNNKYDYIDKLYEYEKTAFYNEAYNKDLLLKSINEYDTIEILLKDDCLIGYIIYRKLDVIHILKIFIDDKYKGNGYAKLLLDSLDDKIYLEVRKNNVSAIRFYEKNNFKIIDIKKDYYQNPTDDALIMVRNG